jgi:UDP:flavonoid glycosyltransferase YjiC (YdhE family)
MGADHPLNASRCAALGLARVLDPKTATPATIREAVRTVLSDPTYKASAKRVEQEQRAMPGPGRAVELLELLGREKAPIHGSA